MKINKYKKLYIFTALFLSALILSPFFDILLNLLMQKFGLFSALIVGYFYSFAFTSGAASVMLANVEEDFLLFSILAAIGAMLADLTLMKIFKLNFKEEIEQLFKFLKINSLISNKWKPVIGLLIIGSPLPDEIGVLLLSQVKGFKRWQFLAICFVANFSFIYLLSRSL